MENFQLRIDDEMKARIDRLAKLMSERIGGTKLGRSAVVRAAIDHGLDHLEAEFSNKSKR